MIKQEYKTVIIGGGIVGAGILRDLADANIETLLVEKKKFGSQTSSKTSKMLHGGIRYLENFDFKLVWEALHEKNYWLKKAPHLCTEKAFYLPIYKESKWPLWMLRIGLFLYDLLSWFQNSPHRILNMDQALRELPGIKKDGLKGCGVYYDAIVDDFKLNNEVIAKARENENIDAFENIEMTSFELINSEKGTEKVKVHLIDTEEKKEYSVICRDLVIATGPFTDKVLANQSIFKWDPVLLPNKGSHLWLKKEALKLNHPMVLNTVDGRVIFVIPHPEKILIGTTEQKIEGDYFDLEPSEKEIQYLLANLNQYFPEANVNETHIISGFAGIRPLVKAGRGGDLSKTAREHKVFNPRPNIHVIVGGKYTTFRVMGKSISKTIIGRWR